MSRKMYKRIYAIESFEQLDKQEHIMYHGDVYHERLWKKWPYREVAERLKNRELFLVKNGS